MGGVARGSGSPLEPHRRAFLAIPVAAAVNLVVTEIVWPRLNAV